MSRAPVTAGSCTILQTAIALVLVSLSLTKSTNVNFFASGGRQTNTSGALVYNAFVFFFQMTSSVLRGEDYERDSTELTRLLLLACYRPANKFPHRAGCRLVEGPHCRARYCSTYSHC
ncbi:hypothetical protein BV22DRAFT_734130 [Leucogyrophana mollusca]|uniref:Uncharacterized protein n=1 Tax=Leucogyrophana mollusca TaxID=85980 RepID=A0ACB8B7A8_9AGAM|nr:hypothetical protein BV22DRAFT_734130 [Leucogyrophana mollusca]